MTSVTGLDGSVTRYEYDALGRRTLTAGGSLTAEYEYDEVGSVVRMATSGDTNVELLYVDQYSDGVAYESKVGYTTLTKRIKTKILKDGELIQTGQINSVEWHFYPSEITGLKGGSQ